MDSNSKAIAFSVLISAAIFIITITILQLFFGMDNVVILSVVAATFSFVLSPRRIVINKQSGREVQLKWIFSKKVIRFK